MAAKLTQSVGSGGQAIQAQGDVIITHGMTPEQMSAIMVGLANQLAHYKEEAAQIAERRIEEIRCELLEKFQKTNESNTNAFRDPDFQHVLLESQKSYARSGDEIVKHVLVDIIARRSNEPVRNRTAITLDEAAVRAPQFGKQEFGILALSYVARYTLRQNIGDFASFVSYIKSDLMPFVPDIPNDASAYWHIESQSCGHVDEVAEVDIMSVFREGYGGVLGKGLDRLVFEKNITEDNKNILNAFMIPCLHDPDKLQPNAINRSVFLKEAAVTGASETSLNNVWMAFSGTIMNPEELITKMVPHIPNVESFFKVWKETPLRQLKLNSVGIAIGHAHASNTVGFSAPLSIWIK